MRTVKGGTLYLQTIINRIGEIKYTYTYCSRLNTCKRQMITPDCGFGPSLVLNNQNLLPVPGYNYKKLEGVNTTPHVRIMPALIYSIIFKKN